MSAGAGRWPRLAYDSAFESGVPPLMQFRLTYEGRLESHGRPSHKHEIRKAFHPQLKQLWETHPALIRWKLPDPPNQDLWKADADTPAHEVLAKHYVRSGYNFVPLVREDIGLLVGLKILFLRPDMPGSIIRSGDIDNRLKTLFDALRLPKDGSELGTYTEPSANEKPFYVLLEDDLLITHVEVETDQLLEATGKAIDMKNDARIVITVSLKPYTFYLGNIGFL